MKLKNFFNLTLIFALFLSFSLNAQKKNKLVIKPNLVLTYVASDPAGNEVVFPLTISEMNDENVKLKYEMKNGGRSIGGEWIISGKGLESGEYLNWQPLSPSEVRKLPNNQTIFSVSRKFFDELKEKKIAKYDDRTFELKAMPKGKDVIIDKQVIDALYIVEKGGDLCYWILNNRKLPFIINSEGAQNGPSFKLSKVGTKKK